jgi:putative nucleotidyltransferase-like protein
MNVVPLGLPSWDRTLKAVDKVRDRLLRATAALEKAGVAYAVIGGNAVAAWVGRVDESAVRFTRDVDVLLRRADLETAKAALEAAGFIFRHAKSIDMFLDGPDAKARDAVHVVFAGEKITPDSIAPAPDVAETEPAEAFRVLRLEALVRMKLTSYRDKDRTHLRDMLDVGLIDASWPARLPAELAERLRVLIENPEG